MGTRRLGIHFAGIHYEPSIKAVRIDQAALKIIRVVWSVYALLALAITALGIGPAYALYRQMCQGEGCGTSQQLDTAGVMRLQAAGLSLDFYAGYLVAAGLIAVVGCLVFAFILIRSQSGELLPVLFAFTSVALSVTSTPFLLIPAVDNPVLRFAYSMQDAFAGAALIPLYCMFPDGRFVPRWTAWAAVILGLPALLYFSPDAIGFETHTTNNATTAILGIDAGLAFLVIIISLFYRYRWVADATQRQQIKWILIFVPMFLLLSVASIGLTIFAPDSILPGAPGWFILNSIGGAIATFSVAIFSMVLLRFHLWDVDLLINRALVYGVLTTFIVGTYVLIVVGLGSLLSTGSSLLLSLVTTALVAVAFQPLREQIQRRVNRLMYGERDDPSRILARLSLQMENVITHEKLLPSIVETVARSLKLPFVQIEWAHPMHLDNGNVHGNDSPAVPDRVAPSVAATYGTAPDRSPNLLRIPLVYQTEMVGQLVLAPRERTDSFSPTDLRTLQALAHQIGLAAHAVRLTQDLQRSRERLVTAREEERRRLRRDLHDGLGPVLSSVLLKLGAARRQLLGSANSSSSSGAGDLIAESSEDLRNAIGDIRRVVHNLRPPVLDQLGLATAIRDFAESISSRDAVGTKVTVELPEALPPLTAAVEVALYRIIQEAVTNVVRHASADKCAVCLSVEETQDRYVLNLDVSDNGVGLPSNHTAGVGLSSMRERAEELGGRFRIEGQPELGTRLLASIPMPRE